MPDIVIQVENLSKLYHIGAKQERSDTLRDWLSGLVRRTQHDARDEALWALKDVSFEVKQGEVVGVIGRNGAGKSTLLKILSRITEPTKGRVVMNGRVGSLLEVGTGFHPELTGRENIYLSGAILGMRRTEIDRRFDEIVDFSGVEKFIDTPFKRFSSGMQVRLGFAVAAHLESEVLLVDEVLAVGDAAFQKKCLGKMGRVSQEGRTILFVSHNLAAIEELCTTCVVINAGRLRMESDSRNAINNYLKSLNPKAPENLKPAEGVLRSVSIRNLSDENSDIFRTGDRIGIILTLDSQDQKIDTPVIGIGINNHLGQRICTVGTYFSKDVLPTIKGSAEVTCIIPSLSLLPGEYHLKVAIGSSFIENFEEHENYSTFTVSPSDYYGTGKLPNTSQGFVAVPSTWSLS